MTLLSLFQRNVKYYFYIRGFWSSPLNRIRADVANKLGLYQIQFDALVYQFNILCKQENMKEADKYLTEIADLVAKNNFSESSLINFTHAKALYYLAKKEYDKAIRLWRVNLKKSTLDEHQLNANRRWLGICYFKRGRAGDLERASDILRNLTDDVMGKGLIHSALSTSVYLAKIDFKKLDFDAANAKIEAALLIADKFYDRAALAELLLLKGDYLLRTKDLENATKILTTAMTHFERLGKSNRVNEIESMLLNVKPKKEVK